MKYTMIVLTVLVLCLLHVDLVRGAGGSAVYGKPGVTAHSNWNYLWGTNLGNWSAQHPICGYSAQSPINVLSKDTVYNSKLGSLVLKNYDQTEGVYFMMKNRDTDIEFAAKTDAGDIPQAVQLGGVTYRLYQLHFHWGSNSFQGSEHLLDSQQYAAEMHIIHYNTKYDNVTEAIDKPDGLLVWGHFLKVSQASGTANNELGKMVGNFGKATECCATTKVSLNLFSLLPIKHDEFFTYAGSLTTPPCYESVKWIVNRNPILVSESQMAVFRGLKDKAMGTDVALVNHYRPAQPINNRKVERNFEKLDCVGSSGVSMKPIASVFALLLVFVYFVSC